MAGPLSLVPAAVAVALPFVGLYLLWRAVRALEAIETYLRHRGGGL